MARAGFWVRTFSVSIGVAAALLLPWASAGGPGAEQESERKAPEVLRLAVALERERKSEQWDRLFDLVAGLQKDVEAKAGEPPYKSRKEMVDVAAHRMLPLAKPGLHSRWSQARHVSKTPPGPGGTYINTAVAVMPNSLTAEAPKNVIVRQEDRRSDEVWDGYISKSIVVVDGTILATSYIYDSIVIAAGPIKLGGYINNSLVISVGSRGQSLVDVEQGYLANCVVVAEEVKAGYASECLVFGKLRTDSLRGAQVRDHADVADIVWHAGRDKEARERGQ